MRFSEETEDKSAPLEAGRVVVLDVLLAVAITKVSCSLPPGYPKAERGVPSPQAFRVVVLGWGTGGGGQLGLGLSAEEFPEVVLGA